MRAVVVAHFLSRVSELVHLSASERSFPSGLSWDFSKGTVGNTPTFALYIDLPAVIFISFLPPWDVTHPTSEDESNLVCHNIRLKGSPSCVIIRWHDKCLLTQPRGLQAGWEWTTRRVPRRAAPRDGCAMQQTQVYSHRWSKWGNIAKSTF